MGACYTAGMLFWASQRAQLTFLGALLCLLAALFAVEAKMAWYAPPESGAIHVSADKLQAAEAPRLVAQALAAAAQLPVLIFVLPLFLLCKAIINTAHRQAVYAARSVAMDTPALLTTLFFRPPPVSSSN